MLVFCNRIETVKQVASVLRGRRCPCEGLMSQCSQAQSDRLLAEFRARGCGVRRLDGLASFPPTKSNWK